MAREILRNLPAHQVLTGLHAADIDAISYPD